MSQGSQGCTSLATGEVHMSQRRLCPLRLAPYRLLGTHLEPGHGLIDLQTSQDAGAPGGHLHSDPWLTLAWPSQSALC